VSDPRRVCARCVMDTSDPDIFFDAGGVCSHCRSAEETFKRIRRSPEESKTALRELAGRIKAAGAGQEYDSIIGLSGGVDSSYLARLARQMGLRPLAVHFDNGWNAELAVENIQRVVEGCSLDLQTYVINWAEFRDLQRAFFKASVIDIEIITDHAILAALVSLADEHKIRFVLSGNNLATEHGLPEAWVWNKQDWTNIKAIHARFGTVPLRTFPHLTRRRWLAIRGFRRGLAFVEPLNLVAYRRDEAAATLAREFGWRDYGGKHHESVFTRFYQSYILPTKFGVDKRRAHLSDRIRNGELTRDEAVAILAEPLYTPEELANEREYVLKKLGFSAEEFAAIMATPPRPHDDFATDRRFFELVRMAYRPIKAASAIASGPSRARRRRPTVARTRDT
jgi:N-acetyl sugar amidotransferase